MRRPLPLHPLLLAASPVLFLYSHNVASLPVSPHELLLPLAASLALALVVLLAAGLVLRDRQKAGISASLFLLLFFLYGGAFTAVQRSPALREFARHQYLLPLGLVIWLAGSWLVARSRRGLGGLTVFLNVAAAAVVLVNVVTGLPAFVRNRPRAEARVAAVAAADKGYPDIYYIILDAYPRADILKDVCGYDNSSFLEFLKSRGFRVAEKGRSNYAQTYLSLASSLNLMYLDSLAARMPPGSDNHAPLIDLIQNNRVMSVLKQHGYTTVAFASGFTGTELHGADIFLAPRWAMSEFQGILLGMTPVQPLVELLSHRSIFDLYRERTLFQLRMLPEAARARHPVFVFCHIIAAHEPFVFGAHGEKVNPAGAFTLTEGGAFRTANRDRISDDYLTGYRNQVSFLTGKVSQTIDRIIAASPRPPVIIVQGDHGRFSVLLWDAPEPDQIYERMAILNACRFPGDSVVFYDSITPVNTFRVLFNRLFGSNYPLLPDRSWFSTLGNPYAFSLVDNRSSYAELHAQRAGMTVVVFLTTATAPANPALYGHELAEFRYPGANRHVDRIYIKTVAAPPSLEQAFSLYRGYVQSGEIPDAGTAYDGYTGPGPDRKPKTVLFLAGGTDR